MLNKRLKSHLLTKVTRLRELKEAREPSKRATALQFTPRDQSQRPHTVFHG
jgi:hypothetical protein